ncbi:MAG: hypothetical protein AB1476_03985 [Candidatus Hadarchaeota archaeon]
MSSEKSAKVFNAVVSSKIGVTTREIQEGTGLSYPTVIKWLEVLNVQGLLRYRQVGRSKLWFASETLEDMDEEDVNRLLKLKKLSIELKGASVGSKEK